MKKTTRLTDFYKRTIGYIEEDTVTGDAVAKDFYGRVVGRYIKNLNTTRDFYGRTVGTGNLLSSLVYEAEKKNRGNK